MNGGGTKLRNKLLTFMRWKMLLDFDKHTNIFGSHTRWRSWPDKNVHAWRKLKMGIYGYEWNQCTAVGYYIQIRNQFSLNFFFFSIFIYSFVFVDNFLIHRFNTFRFFQFFSSLFTSTALRYNSKLIVFVISSSMHSYRMPVICFNAYFSQINVDVSSTLFVMFSPFPSSLFSGLCSVSQCPHGENHLKYVTPYHHMISNPFPNTLFFCIRISFCVGTTNRRE